MKHISAKQSAELREAFVRNLGLDFFEDDEVEYILKEIDSYDLLVRQKVLALCLALSHASSSLVPRALRHIKTVSGALSPDDLDRWVSAAFDLLDSQGMDQGLDFLSRVDARDLKAFQVREGLPLREAAPLIETYLRAISGREFKIIHDQETYTDTSNIHLPPAVNRFAGREKNLLVYKLAAAYAWAQTATGTLTLDVDIKVIQDRFHDYPFARPEIDAFFSLFPERELALDLYTVLESMRIDGFLAKELPGLMKQAGAVKRALFAERPELPALSEKSAFVEGLWQHYLVKKTKGPMPEKLAHAVASVSRIKQERGPGKSVQLLFDLYTVAASLSGDYSARPVPIFIGLIKPDKISARVRELQAAHKKKLEGMLAKLIDMPGFEPRKPTAEKAVPQQSLLEPAREYLMIKGRLIELDEELRSLIEERGGVPGGVLVKGSEIGAGAPLMLQDLVNGEEAETVAGGTKYDEWDYKRGGYKKRWCSLYEHDIHPGHEPFVELTLKRYGGYVTVLRKKFELLKREPRLERRQKDGDDIDLDAVVESFADMRAGISPPENLFARTDRHERNIAVLFLVDMSGSTKGWVNEAEKESLVLMSEALETLGDRYAVYGFSGMTRNRCDLYRVKGFDEPYAESVKRRIAGIEPKDYTRMGPFIRHAITLLKTVDARTRLLITLSDGKPEDWDAYKGDYGIEDTRKALIESREQGIHAFCITIDHEAQSYLPHMFGEANYIFIDDVSKLPNRITEIYRRLTT
jgi:nitric oxide reductase NorD protein